MFQLAPTAPCSMIGCHQEEPGSVLLTLVLYIFININKVTPQSPLLQAKETQLPQPFLIRKMLHSLNHCGSALDSLKQFPVLLDLRGPELDAIFQMWSRQGRVKGEENRSRPTNHTPPNTPLDAIGLLGHKGTVLAHGHPVVHQDPQVPLPFAALQQGSPQPILVSGVVLAQMQDSTLALILFH